MMRLFLAAGSRLGTGLALSVMLLGSLIAVSGCTDTGGSTGVVPATFTVRGNVVDVTTLAPVGTTITGLPGGPYTSTNGTINIPNIPLNGAPYTVTISAAGYQPTTVQVTSSGSLGTIHLTPVGATTFTVTGAVVDQNGSPVFATITGLPGGTVTADNTFSVANVPVSGQPYTVTFTANGFAPKTIQVSSPGSLGNVVLAPAGQTFTVTGTIINASGQPVTATVSGLPGGTVTATNGVLSVQNVPVGTTPYTVVISAPGYNSMTLQVSSPGTLGTITLTPTAPTTFTATGSAVDVNTGVAVPVTVTVPGVTGSPFTFLNGIINIPNIPTAGAPYTVTIQGLSNSLQYFPQTIQLTTTGTIGTLQLVSVPCPPSGCPNPLPSGR